MFTYFFYLIILKNSTEVLLQKNPCLNWKDPGTRILAKATDCIDFDTLTIFSMKISFHLPP